MPQAAEIEQVDVVELNMQTGQENQDAVPLDYRKRQASNNRLWLISFVVVLVAAGWIIWYLGEQDQERARRVSTEIASLRRPAIDSQRHTAAANEMQGRIVGEGVSGAWVRFVDPDLVEVELPATANRDSVTSVKKIVRDVAMTRLNEEPTIVTYFAKTPGAGYRSQADLESGKK